eukprot:superscaffoldBa00002651_g14909
MRRKQARAECFHITGSARLNRIQQDEKSPYEDSVSFLKGKVKLPFPTLRACPRAGCEQLRAERGGADCSITEAGVISIECVDDRDGRNSVVVYDDKTFPISLRQDAIQEIASGDGRGRHSSVRVFQRPHYEVVDTNIQQGPPETSGDSHASLEEQVDEEE